MTRTPNGLKFSGKDNSTPGVAANGKLMVIVIKAEPISKTARSLPLLPSRAEGSVDDWAAFAVCPEVGPVDRDIRNRLALIDSGNFPNAVGAGTRGGDPFNNHSVQLPTRTSGGTPITYQEWDVRDKLPNQNRNQERIVIGSDGSAYYTGDHYDTFVRIR
ncbi:ribonuclease [Mycobacteroides chelonae]|nr:ribonuclease [Mycobacteroides chelonae]